MSHVTQIGVVGAGIMGRLIAWQLARQGNAVTLFDRDKTKHERAAAFTAAGMLTPLSEADSAEDTIVQLGKQSLALWPAIVEELNADVDFHQTGSLIIAHANDHADLINFRQHVSRLHFTENEMQCLDKKQLASLEPGLAKSFSEASFIANEAWISPPLFLNALTQHLKQMGVVFNEGITLNKVEPGNVYSGSTRWTFDTVIDCRGLGAKTDLPQLRGVRGEVVQLYAPEVEFKHLIRLMHPRYRIYIVPRANHHFVVGATQIETASEEPITVRSALELLSAAYSVHPGFGEANIVETRTSCRPALPNNLPKILYQPGLMRINGLFRHGFLLAPALANDALRLLAGDSSFIGTVPGIIERQTSFVSVAAH